jgi:hypothetical protein
MLVLDKSAEKGDPLGTLPSFTYVSKLVLDNFK